MAAQPNNMPLDTHQEIIDVALDILTEQLRPTLTLAAVAQKLTRDYHFRTTAADLSKVREVSLSGGIYVRGKSTRYRKQRATIAAKLVSFNSPLKKGNYALK